MTPNARAQLVQADTEKRAHDLDFKYPGSTFTQILKSHGKDGRYLVLVVIARFSRFPARSDDYLNAFFTDPRHGDIAVDISQGHRV